MPRKRNPPPFDLSAPAPSRLPSPAAPLPELALGPGVRVVLEGADFLAVEAAAAELKARFGARFAVTTRRRINRGAALRLTGALQIHAADVLDAGG